jgi:hypothetical protein
MEKDLIKFMEKMSIFNKDFAQYQDEEKGIEFLFNTINAVVNVDYLELDKQQYEVAKFQNKIEDLEYEIETIKKAVPKNEITGKDEDKFTITEKDVAVRKVWNVSNRLGAYKSFTNKQSALECADNINKLIFDVILK